MRVENWGLRYLVDDLYYVGERHQRGKNQVRVMRSKGQLSLKAVTLLVITQNYYCHKTC